MNIPRGKALEALIQRHHNNFVRNKKLDSINRQMDDILIQINILDTRYEMALLDEEKERIQQRINILVDFYNALFNDLISIT